MVVHCINDIQSKFKHNNEKPYKRVNISNSNRINVHDFEDSMSYSDTSSSDYSVSSDVEVESDSHVEYFIDSDY